MRRVGQNKNERVWKGQMKLRVRLVYYIRVIRFCLLWGDKGLGRGGGSGNVEGGREQVRKCYLGIQLCWIDIGIDFRIFNVIFFKLRFE